MSSGTHFTVHICIPINYATTITLLLRVIIMVITVYAIYDMYKYLYTRLCHKKQSINRRGAAQ